MFKNLGNRWEGEETKLGKILKYYFGYIGIGASFITRHIDDIYGLFYSSRLEIPSWIPEFLFICGLLSYIGGKLTKKPQNDLPKNQN